MTAAQVIDAGPGHIEAWSLAEDLSSRFEAFARYAVIVGRDMATVGIGTSFNHPLGSLVAFFIEGDDLDAAARNFVIDTREAGTYRAGAFQAMVSGSGCKLALNSPREAQAKCEAYSQRFAAALEAERAATQGALT